MKFLVIILSLLWLQHFSQHVNAQSTDIEKIEISISEHSKSIKGFIKGRKIIDYKTSLKAGQVLQINLATNNTANYFNLLPPGSTDVAIYNSSVGGNEYKDKLQKTGVYTVRVYLMRNAARRNETAKFTLSVKLADK